MKKILSLFFALLCVGMARAAELPTVSTEGNEVWYLVQFMNGGNVLTAQGDGENAIAGAPMAKDSQLWKLEGSETAGYTLTSKTGLKLYTTTTALSGMFHAAAAPASNTLFVIQTTTNTTYSDGFVISPKANTSVYMNQWGGASTGAQLGLWNTRSDANQPLTFVAVEDFLSDGQPLPLIPYPASLTRGEGSYAASALTAITYANEASKPLAETFAAQFQTVTGQTLAVELAGTSAKANAVNMVLDATKAAEGYGLTIDANGVVITASEYAGFFYGLQTLRQLLPAAIYADARVDATAWTLPYVVIDDEPLLGYRGFHFDVARHFFEMDEIKKLLDVAAIYKLNRFHWHLTDDQGWRVEIPEYPKLTTVGAVRKASFTLEASPKYYDDTEYGVGCFYTLDELRDVVAYAKERNIEIIPEIDLPGHMVAAVAAYPELSCDPTKTYEVRVDGGISQDVLNVGDDKVIDFLKCVLGHVAEVFPYQYLHIGGDECPTGAWSNNADCARRIAEEGLTGVEELQPWLVEELGTWLKTEHGKDIVVWDELLAHWSDKFTVKPLVMAWNSANKANEAASHGLSSVTVPYQYLYFDFMQVSEAQEIIDEPYIGGWGINDLPEVYNFNPLGTMSGQEHYMIGTQANLWTETCSSNKEAEYQFYPRLLALSEIAWLPAAKKNWMNFYLRLQQGVKVLDANDIYYAKHYIEEPELTSAEAAIEEAEELLAASKPGKVGYPAVDDYTDLLTAYEDATDDLNDEEAAARLVTAIENYKQAPLVNLENGKLYQIFSASTATRVRYNGSSVYVKNGQLRMHYTPQLEPEELWEAVEQGDGSFVLKQATTGKVIEMPAYGSAVSVSDNATPIVIGKPTANASYSYIPGVVTLSAAADQTGDIRRFFGNNSGLITANNNAELCYGGTWRIVEVTDYKAFLEALCKKCERITETVKVGEMEQPTAEAIDFLKNSVIAPARAALATEEEVTEEVYMTYADLYQQYVDMPRTSVISSISEGVYYRIRNAYFTAQYAEAAARAGTVQPKTLDTTEDCQLWRFVKNENGTVQIINKGTGKAAYVASSTEGVSVIAKYAGTGLVDWTVVQITTDQGATGLAIVEASGTYSWYTNPSSFSDIILKPKDWGASIWVLEATEIETGIENAEVVQPAGEADAIYYDLHGRRVQSLSEGIYVSSAGEKVLK